MGRLIKSKELIEMFAQRIYGKYPELTHQHIVNICRGEFLMMKRIMESGTLEPLRLQYLFQLRVSPAKIMASLALMDKFEPGKGMNEQRREFYMNQVLEYIKNNYKKFKKYDKEIKGYTGFTSEEIGQGKHLSD